MLTNIRMKFIQGLGRSGLLARRRKGRSKNKRKLKLGLVGKILRGMVRRGGKIRNMDNSINKINAINIINVIK
jgi:hypothetical protein